MDELSKRVLSELSTQFRTVWDIYITFYTAFLVFNITGLAVVAEKVTHRGAKYIIVVAFVLQNIVSGVTAGMIGNYSKHTSDRAQQIIVHNANASTNATPAIKNLLKEESPLPGGLALYGGWANCFSHLLMIASWTAVLFVDKREHPRIVLPQQPRTPTSIADV
jgi:hypothetical protein